MSEAMRWMTPLTLLGSRRRPAGRNVSRTSATVSTASLLSSGSGSRVANWASHRCTAVSWANRRCQKAATFRCGAQFHVGRSGSSESRKAPIRASSSLNHSITVGSSAGGASSGTTTGPQASPASVEPALRRTRWYTAPRWRASSPTVQSGQLGTCLPSASGSLTAARNAAPSARTAATQKSFDPWLRLTRPPTAPVCTQLRVSAVFDVTRVPLAEHTTLRLGGPATELVVATDQEQLVAFVREGPAVLLAGGSNVVISDSGVDGRVVLVRSTGIQADRAGDDRVRLTVQAGHVWGEVVQYAVSEGLAGLECLSGIPGSAGATPIQNVGAYGQEVAESIVAVRVL